MIGNRTPHWFLLALALGIAVAGIMLSVFYGQYQWLARQLVETSATEYDQLAKDSFERRARAQLHAAAVDLAGSVESQNSQAILPALNTILIANEGLTGVRYVDHSGLIYVSGSFPGTTVSSSTVWLEERLLISYPVIVDHKETGVLFGAYDLGELFADVGSFHSGTREHRGGKSTDQLPVGGDRDTGSIVTVWRGDMAGCPESNKAYTSTQGSG